MIRLTKALSSYVEIPISHHMKNYILLSMGLLILSACDRMSLDDSKSSVHIQLPNIQGGLSKIDDVQGLSGSGSTGPVPATLAQFNCFMVAVSGPTDSLRRNVCGKKDANGNYDPASLKYIGIWSGGAVAGSDIILDNVESGKDRVIHVIGFRAVTPTTDCKDFKTNGFPGDGLISDPYILGTVGGLELKSGETASVSVPIDFSTVSGEQEKQRFDGCRGPDFPERSGGGSLFVPTKLAIEKNIFPYGSVQENQCVHLNATLRDKNDNSGPATSDITFNLSSTLSYSGTSVFYESFEDCQVPRNPKTSLTFLKDTNWKSIVVTVPSPAPSPTPTLTITAAPPPATGVASSTQIFSVKSNGSNALDLDGPNRLLSGFCYPMMLTAKTLSAPVWNVTSLTQQAITANSDFKIYTSLLDCINNPTGDSGITSTPGLSAAPLLIYGKYLDSSINSSTSFEVMETSASQPYIRKNISKGYGNRTVSGTQVHGSNVMQISSANQCMNYEITAVNNYGTPIPVPSNLNTAISVTSTSAITMSVFLDTDCSSAVQPSIAKTIPKDDYRARFSVLFTKASGTDGNVYPVAITFDGKSYPVSVKIVP